jgi:predicted nucleic acid-binding protein
MAEYPKLNQVDRLIDNETIQLVSSSRQAHEHFRELIGHLGKGEASYIAYAKERNVNDTAKKTQVRNLSNLRLFYCGTRP